MGKDNESLNRLLDPKPDEREVSPFDWVFKTEWTVELVEARDDMIFRVRDAGAAPSDVLQAIVKGLNGYARLAAERDELAQQVDALTVGKFKEFLGLVGRPGGEALDKLKAERDELRAEFTRLQDELNLVKRICDRDAKTANRLTAEVERLKEAPLLGPHGKEVILLQCQQSHEWTAYEGETELGCPHCMRAEIERLRGRMDHVMVETLREENERLRADGERYRKALLQILRIHERHVPEATGRKIADFREAMLVARAAIDAARSGEGE